MEDMLFYRINSEFLPVVKYVEQVSVEPPQIHIRRKAEEFILYYILDGEMHINEGDRPFLLRQDDMLLLDPHYEHYGTKAAACTYFYIHFYHRKMAECAGNRGEIRNELVDYRLASLKSTECEKKETGFYDFVLPKQLHVSQPSSSISLIDMLRALREAHHNHLEHYQLKASCILMEFLLALSRELTSGLLYGDTSAPSARSTRMIHDLLSFFQSHYASRITGKSLEGTFGCSYDYMNRTFKKATGATIFAYLNGMRIFKARQLLSDGTSKVSEVAEKCGFRDIYYFSRVFKKYTGATPSAYAKGGD